MTDEARSGSARVSGEASPSGSAAPDVGSARMEARRRRRRRRRQLVALALALLALLTLAVTWRLAADPAPPPAAAGQDLERTQRTLLLALQAANGDAAAAALLAHDPVAETGAVVLVPPQLLVPVPGRGSLTLARALRTVPPEASRSAVADLLGVIMDDGWVLDLPSLQGLVDVLGGVPVEVDRPVERGGELVLQPGRQRLSGVQTVAYVTYRAAEEQEQARLARVQAVLDGLLDALPASVEEAAQVVGGLGARSIATLPPDGLARLLTGLERSDAARQLQYDTLPVLPIDTGAAGTTFRLDTDRAPALVDRLLAASVPPGAREEGNRVLVLNGVGTPGLGERVRARLVPRGFVFVGSRNAARFGYDRSQVLVPERSGEALELGNRVAEALGLPPDSVRSTDRLGSVADVVVLVGADFAA
ncbi:MAG: LCP family protein [Actinomycetota bacterium]|nr:LCP family protein [Actinomycetota bacterium]